MIECKEDVVVWFQQLESYKRIDAMCALLTSCLSFELRFFGTYLEDLVSRDYERLRSIELRVNNAPELIQNLATCQQADPTDLRVRRRLAMYLALIRNVNRKCCNELYKTLEMWGRRDCLEKYAGQDERFMEELLLIYIMAKNHPVLAFDQRLKCAEIFQVLYEQQQSQQSSPPVCATSEATTTTGVSGSTSPSPTTMPPVHLQQQQPQTQQPTATTAINYQPAPQTHPLLGHHQIAAHTQHSHHVPQTHHHHPQAAAPTAATAQFIDSNSTTHLYGAAQLIQSAQPTTHIPVHPGHPLYPQLIPGQDGLSQPQTPPTQQQQPQSISLDQFHAQYLENPFMTATGTTVTPIAAQNMVQWAPTAYRHAAPAIDTSIPPPQLPMHPQSSTSSSSSQIISQSSSPTHSRTASPVRSVAAASGGATGNASTGLVNSSSNSKLAAKRSSRRPSGDQTTPPPPQSVDMMAANKNYDETPDHLRNGYVRQSTGGGVGRLSKTTYSMHHHHQQQQQQQQQQQFQTAHHLTNFHVHPQYNFIQTNHQLQQHHPLHPQQQQQQPPQLVEYVTFNSKTGTVTPTTVLITGGGSGGGGAASDSGSNSNDDCSPTDTPTTTTTIPGGSALQNRLKAGGGGGVQQQPQLVYVNSHKEAGGNNNSNMMTTSTNSNSSNSNELTANPGQHPPMSSSPVMIQAQYVGGGGQKGSQRYQPQPPSMHGAATATELQVPEVVTLAGGDAPQLYYNNHHHFVSHGHHPQPHPHQQPQQQQQPPHLHHQQQHHHHHHPSTHIPALLQAGHSLIAAQPPTATAHYQVGYATIPPQAQQLVAAVPPPQINSCYNCGSQAHSGLECKETSMEDAIHHSNYKLEYRHQQQGEIAEENEEEEEEEEQQQQQQQSRDAEGTRSPSQKQSPVGGDDDDEVIEVSSSNSGDEGESVGSHQNHRRGKQDDMLLHRFNSLGLDTGNSLSLSHTTRSSSSSRSNRDSAEVVTGDGGTRYRHRSPATTTAAAAGKGGKY